MKVYSHPADSVVCNLAEVGKKTCEVDFWHEVQSQNGTVAIQSEGKIKVSTECFQIKEANVNLVW